MQVHEEVQINHEDVINEFAEQTHQSEIEQASLAQPIDLLESHGITKIDIEKLKKAGIYTVESIYHIHSKDLLATSRIPEAKLAKIRDIVSEHFPREFHTATTLGNERKNLVRITTGSNSLNIALGGGVETGSLTEVFGEFKAGKTQFCHTLCVTAQLPRQMGGGEGRVMYIDTEGTFRPERIEAIASYYGMVPEEVLDNIVCARALSSEHQQDLLKRAAQLLSQDRYSLLVVDSATALFRTDYNGRGELSNRQVQLGKFLRQLHVLATTFGVAVVLTNQVVSDVGAAAFLGGGDTKKPIGGNIMAHASTTRLQFKKGRGNCRTCKIYDSPLVAETEVQFSISVGGVVDAEDDSKQGAEW